MASSKFADKFGGAGGAFAKLLEAFGEAITYTPVATRVGISRSAIYNRMTYAVDQNQDAHFQMSSDATLGVATPVRGDRITHEGTIWTVEDARADDDGSHELKCRAPERVT